jgi:NADH:ubiquinone oxidoreductase subunit 3 (subunit A)
MPHDEHVLYTYIFVFLATGIAVAAAPLIIARVLRLSRNPSDTALQPYECGIQTRDYAWDSRYGIAYYLYALIFLAFEVDVLYLFPVAAAFDAGSGTKALMMLGLFLGVLSMALIYAWKKGSFEWKTLFIEKSSAPPQEPM